MFAEGSLRRLCARHILISFVLVFSIAFPGRGGTFTLSNGSLDLLINDVTGSIYDVQFGGSNFYLPGIPVSDYGFQLGTDDSTFVLNPFPLEVVNTGTTGLVSGIYEDMGFFRAYSLIPDQNAFQVSTTLINFGSEKLVRQFETFDPDQGSNIGLGPSTYNNVRSYEGPAGSFKAGHASIDTGISVVIGSTDSSTLVASGYPFQINNGFGLNDFFSNPFDGGGSFADQGTHLGLETLLGSGQSRTFTYVQAFGSSLDEAVNTFADVTSSTPKFESPQDYYTEQHPLNSSIALEVYLGDPNAGGTKLATVGPSDLIGLMNSTVDLDASGTGGLTVHFADLTLNNVVSQLVDLGALGTVDASLLGIHFDMQLQVPVVEHVFELDNATAFLITIDGGLAILDNATGVIAGLLGGDVVQDYGAFPTSISLASVAGLGLVGTAEADQINLDLTGISTRLYSFAGGIEIYARFVSEIHVAVPEVSSLVLLGAVGVVVVGVQIRRRR